LAISAVLDLPNAGYIKLEFRTEFGAETIP
jgi:hypothetical protein